jgi:carboxyl-terminal processing protease
MQSTRLRFTVVVLAVALVAAGCALFESDVNPTGTTTTTTTRVPVAPTTTQIAGLQLDITGCDDPADEWALLCDTYDVLAAHYVDGLDNAALAAGAVEAVTETEPDDSVPAWDSLRCSVPTPEFTDVCDAYGAGQAADPGPVAEYVEAAVIGMLDSLDDPATVYLDPDAVERLNEDQSGQVEGIGALVWAVEDGERCSVLSGTCLMTIASVLAGSPAEAAGVLDGDAVVSVNGESVEGWTMDEAVAEVRGPAGTDVVLGILRDSELLEITVTRAAVVVPVLESEMIDSSTGYLLLSYFPSNSGGQVRDALAELIDAGALRIVFDMQNNPGGSLQAAVMIASQFLSDGIVVRTESPVRDTEYPVLSGGAATDEALEIVVLVNRASASASEVVAGALQEAGRAVVIGENTFGKNTVQQQFNLPSAPGALKVTTARWVTPDGLDFGKEGITPDILVEVSEDSGPDVILDAALDYLGVEPAQ